MFINFAHKLFEILVQDEFTYIRQMDNTLVFETEALSLYKDKGSVLYIVTIVNAAQMSTEDYRQRIQAYSRLADGKNRGSVLLMNVIADDPEQHFRTEEDFLPGKDSYVFEYFVDIEQGTVTAAEVQPDLLDMLAKINTALGKPEERYVNGTDLSQLQYNLDRKYDFPVRSDNCYLTYGLIAVNILLWALMEFSGGSEDNWVLTAYGAVSQSLCWYSGEYFRLFTAMFLHIGMAHLASNCLSLYIFGSRVERYFGKVQFLMIYVIAGVFGNIVTVCLLPQLSAGASGAIFGLLGAILAVTYRTGRSMGDLSPYVVVLLCIFSIGMGFIMPGVNNFAHVAGFAAGALIGYFSYRRVAHSENLVSKG